VIDVAAVRALAAEHIRELGLSGPPFDHQASLAARQLQLAPVSLEEILADSNLPEDARDKIDGFVDLNSRIVCLRGDLHPHQRRTGLLHEVAHDIFPWQRELLLHHYCSIFLPPELQREFELEANRFAVECTFFGDRFVELTNSHPHHLRTAVAFAGDHAASFESTFRHYVECHPGFCLLLVSTLVEYDPDTGEPVFEVRQYVRSPAATIVVRPRQRFSGPELARLVSGVTGYELIEHEVEMANGAETRRFVAQSFWNTYKLFTLVWL
jgi:hypothetical protein